MTSHSRFLKPMRGSLGVALLIGCGSYEPSPVDTDPTPRDWRAVVRDTSRPVDDRVQAALHGIATSTGGTSAIFGLGPEHLSPDLDPSERVMIFDVLTPNVDMLRHRHRIVGFHRVTAGGDIEALNVSWTLPRSFGEILTGFANFPPVPASALAALSVPLAEAFGDDVPLTATHGLGVHWIVADRVPDRGLVFVDNHLVTFHHAIPETVCAITDVGDEVLFDQLRDHAETIADGLEKLIEDYDVGYINVSWGITLKTVRSPWARVCGVSPPTEDVLLKVLAAYAPIFEVLLATPNVATAHAALQSPTPEHAPYDQRSAEYPNRIRVGSLQSTSTAIGEDGSPTAPPGAVAQPGDRDYADIYVSSGCGDFECRAEHFLTRTGPFGTGAHPFAVTQSSFVTPIALAELVALRKGAAYRDRALDDGLIAELFGHMSTSCDATPCFRDPLQSGRLPPP